MARLASDHVIVDAVLAKMAHRFIEEPYLAYTECGLHALCFSIIRDALREADRFVEFEGRKVSRLQREYRTPFHLGKSRRQGWDVCLLENPAAPLPGLTPPYDYLRPSAVVEFGLNADVRHVRGDARRLATAGSLVGAKFLVHFIRISDAASRFSNRDIGPDWKANLAPEVFEALPLRDEMTVYLAVADATGTRPSGVWKKTGRAGLRSSR